MATNTLKCFVLFLFFLVFGNAKAQQFPFEVNYEKLEYRYVDSLDFVVVNNDSLTWYLTVGLEKLTEYHLWEEITPNITLSKSYINGESKDDLCYYLGPLKSVKINQPICQINIPVVVQQDSVYQDKGGLYRLSAMNTNNPKQVLTGEFRLSIKCIDDMYEETYWVFKSKSFRID